MVATEIVNDVGLGVSLKPFFEAFVKHFAKICLEIYFSDGHNHQSFFTVVCDLVATKRQPPSFSPFS